MLRKIRGRGFNIPGSMDTSLNLDYTSHVDNTQTIDADQYKSNFS